MNSSESIVLGIVTGLITACLIYLISKIFQRIVIPWYQELMYQGIDLSGSWEVNPLSPHARHIFFDLSQKANLIIGTAAHSVKSETVKGDKVRTYVLKGRIKDRFIWLQGHCIDPKRLGVTSYLLESIGDGRTLRGSFSVYDIGISEIVTTQCLVERR
jgi:hypothetical protein